MELFAGERMRLVSEIAIDRSPETVWNYLQSVPNIAQWDRGVARTEMTGAVAEGGVGTEFRTFARAEGDDWGSMTYRVASVEENCCRVNLTSREGNARFFREASWTFKTRPLAQGTVLTCIADFTLRLPFLFLAPLLYLKREAITADLRSLKCAIENPGR